MKEIQHIERALPTKGHSPMYNMHKFFARKEEDVISAYIEAYTAKDQIVLDPFCGSGVMINEALRLKRRAIGIDINPVAIFITRNTGLKVPISDIKLEYKKIEDDISDDISALYTTRCRKCKNRIVPAICFTWRKNELIDVRYKCPEHGRRIDKIDEYDMERWEEVNSHSNKLFFDDSGNFKYWIPNAELYYSSGKPFKEKQKYNKVSDLFTTRNLVALSYLLDRIKRITNKDLRDAFEFAFSSITHLASKMTPVRESRKFSSAWTQQSYWFAEHNMESNVWELFHRAVLDKQGLMAAKRDLNSKMGNFTETGSIEKFFKGPKELCLVTESCIDALAKMPENSVDYVITDPPYGHSIQYGELLFMWGSWLGLMDNFDYIAKGEIVENPEQNKSIKDYESMLYQAFRKVFAAIKPEGYCTVTFHNPDLKYRNILFRSVVRAGFTFEKIIYQPPPRPSAKSRLQPFGSLEGDYFFRFRKPKDVLNANQESMDEKRVEELIVDTTKRIIAERGEPTQYVFIQNAIDPLLFEELRKYGLLMSHNPKKVENVLKNRIPDDFQLIEMEIGKKGSRTLLGKGWWFSDPSKYHLEIPLHKRVEEAIINLLRREGRVTFTQVLTEVYTKFQNSLTPETDTIKSILEENADPTGSKTEARWQLKPWVESRHRMHEEIVYKLAFLSKKCGLDTDIAIDEYSKLYEGKKLEDQLNLKTIDFRNKNEEMVDRIRRIDVIWHNGEEVLAEFEVEDSTSIVDAIIRGTNLIGNNIRRFIVVPEEREDLVLRRFREPGIISLMHDSIWTLITYSDLNKFFEAHKTKKAVDLGEFFSLGRMPRSKTEIQDQKQRKLTENP